MYKKCYTLNLEKSGERMQAFYTSVDADANNYTDAIADADAHAHADAGADACDNADADAEAMNFDCIYLQKYPEP